MKFRHEWKHQITYLDMLVLRQRLAAVAKRDPHAKNGKYFIRSLYFDTANDKALREKIDGVNVREKFRLRYYDGDTSFINLEKKSKINGLCSKQSAPLTRAQAQAIIDGDYSWMTAAQNPLITEFYAKLTAQGLRPKTIVDYDREPFVYAPGNVRVTIDSSIRTGLGCTDFLNPDTLSMPAGDSPIILEVKWDEYLPDIIKDAVQLTGRRSAPFSKYAACRIYG
jgi:hypothetical protein